MYKIGGLNKDELGLIFVKDKMSFVAVKRGKINRLLQNIRGKKIKGKSVLCKRAYENEKRKH